MNNPIQIDWCHNCRKMTKHQFVKKNWTCLECLPVSSKKINNSFVRVRKNSKITPENMALLLERRLSGEKSKDLAKEFGCSVQTIQDHVRGFVATRALINKWIDERIIALVKENSIKNL